MTSAPFTGTQALTRVPSSIQFRLARLLLKLRWQPRLKIKVLDSSTGRSYTITYNLAAVFWSSTSYAGGRREMTWTAYGSPVGLVASNGDELIKPGWGWQRPAADRIYRGSNGTGTIEFHAANQMPSV